MRRADRITVEEDEGRFVLKIETDDGVKLWIDIHDIAIEFHGAVRREIGPWAREAEDAQQAVRRGVSLSEFAGFVDRLDDGGYALDDPKHPTYHDRMVGDA